MIKTITKGDKVWVNSPRIVRAGRGPQRAIIIVLTDNLGKQVGVQFEEPGIGLHNCDGYGSDMNCLWVRAVDLLNDQEVTDLMTMYAESQKHAAAMSFKEVPSITIE